MNKIVQFPLVRMLISLVFIGIGIAVGQIVLNLLRSAFSITNIGIASLLAFVLITPASYFAYWMYVRYMEGRELTELGHEKAIQEFGVGSFIGIGIAVGHASATIFSAIAIALQAGVLLGTTYALTGRL